VYFAHGWQKLFTYGLAGVHGTFTQMGIPLPAISSPLVTFVELLGGAALVLGVLTRWAAVLLAIDMAGAILLVHLKNGFFMPAGFEYALTLLAANIALALGGAGSLSVEGLIMRRK
jgi:putative oxidoreductase